MPNKPRILTRIAAATVLAASLGWATTAPGIASTTPSGDQAPITWSMSPLTDQSPTSKQWLELSLEPGQTSAQQLQIKNHSEQPATFGLQAADGYFTETGRFNMLDSEEASSAAGTWIEIQDEVTVAPKSSETVSFTVTVPHNATPGDHAAGVASVISSVGQSAEGASVGLESRIGFRVMTRVEGQLAPALELAEIDAKYSQSWNPFAPGQIAVDFQLSNGGNVQLDPHTSLTTVMQGQTPALQSSSLLPGDSARVVATLERAWPIVLSPLSLQVSGSDASGQQQVLLSERVWVWTLPLPQLLILCGVLLCVLGLRHRKSKQNRRFEQLLEQARREGAAREKQTTSGQGGQ